MKAMTTRERLFQGFGLGLAVLVFADLLVIRVASSGRDAYAEFVGSPGTLAATALIVVCAMALGHAILGLARAEAPASPSVHPDASVRSLQRLAGVAAVPFLCTRIAWSPLAAALLGLDGYGLHQAMRDRLPTPAFVAISCVGIASVAVHLHQGLSALGRRIGLRRHTPFAFAFAAAYFLLWLDVLAYFVTGRALVG